MDTNKLKRDISDILKNADFSKISTKKIRLQLEEKYQISLIDKKNEIDQIVMAEIEEIERLKEEKSSKEKEASTFSANKSEKPNSSSTSTKIKNPPKVAQTSVLKTVQTTSVNGSVISDNNRIDHNAGKTEKNGINDISNDDESDDSNDSPMEDDQLQESKNKMEDEDIARQLQEEENGSVRRTRHANKKKKTAKKEKKERKKGVPRENKFTESCQLSPELAAIMGEDKMRRSDVVKKMWQIVKEKNLYDPKNKQYMICNDEMHKVFGKKKVRLFGMMKHLTNHIYHKDD